MTTYTWPNTMAYCPKCGTYYYGAHSCMGQLLLIAAVIAAVPFFVLVVKP